MLSARRTLILVWLYLSLFLIPELLIGLHLGIFFWVALTLSFLFGIYVFRHGSHMLQYYYIFFIFTLVFGYFFQFWVGIRYISGLRVPSKMDAAVVAVLGLHFLGLLVGAILHGPAKARSEPAVREVTSDQFIFIGFIVLALLVVIATAIAGYDKMFSSRIETYTEDASSFQLFAVLVAKAACYIYVAGAIGCIRRDSRLQYILIALLLSTALIVANPFNTARFICLSGLVLVVMAIIAKTRYRKNILGFLVLSSYIAIIVLPVTSLLRNGFAGITFDKAFSVFSGLELSSIQVMIDAVHSADAVPSGNLVVSGFAILVPSSLIGFKADAVGPSIAAINNYTFYNTSVPSFFVSYLDFGYVGVVLFSALMGYLFQSVQIGSAFTLRYRSQAYKLILLALTPIIARGDFSTAMIGLYGFFLAYEAFHWALNLRVRLKSARPIRGIS